MDYCLLLKIWTLNIVKNFLIVPKKSTTDAIKSTSKRVTEKTADATGDLVGNKIADKIRSPSKELYSKTDEYEINIPKEKYIPPEKRQHITDDLRLA